MLNIFQRNRVIILKAPLTGEVIRLQDVPDQAFSQKMIGDGIAIKPTNPYLVSPVKGEIIKVFPSNHALGIKTGEGLEILLHLGIDSVELKGKGFEAVIKEGQRVKPGERLVKIDWDLIDGEIASTISPIVITNMEMVGGIKLLTDGNVQSGDDLLAVTIKLPRDNSDKLKD